MKILLALLLLSSSAFAGTDLVMQWDDTQTGIVAYNVYEVLSGGSSAQKIGSTPTKTFSVKAISAGAHTYYVTAANASAESAPSNLLIVPGAVTNLRAVFTITVP